MLYVLIAAGVLPYLLGVSLTYGYLMQRQDFRHGDMGMAVALGIFWPILWSLSLVIWPLIKLLRFGEWLFDPDREPLRKPKVKLPKATARSI